MQAIWNSRVGWRHGNWHPSCVALPSRIDNAHSAGRWGANGGAVQVSPLWWNSGEVKIGRREKGGVAESSPTPHFKSINSLVLSFLYSLWFTLLSSFNFYCSTEVFNFNEVQMINFSFINCAFCVFALVSRGFFQHLIEKNRFKMTCPGSASADSTSVSSSRMFFICHTGGRRSGVCPHARVCERTDKDTSE